MKNHERAWNETLVRFIIDEEATMSDREYFVLSGLSSVPRERMRGQYSR